jgi:hypothetical protein
LARKLHNAERGNSYYAYDLEALAVREAVMHWRCYLEGRSNFMVVPDHDTLRYLLNQPNDTLYKRHTRYAQDLQSFTGAMTLAYRKGSKNEASPFNRRANFFRTNLSPDVLG